MTITERNRKQHGLREQHRHYCRMADWCNEEIIRLNREYKEQNYNLYGEVA